ncbi:glycosyltransferase [Candidatus Stoquefichus massiliensis]|uniref:glycosyltransferase n=1 Tax=Candidatus Stoquefichus massiliensis TaxID=1470350 RepID=UPI000485A535|nr:glycosyltransferase [Candidatus Stoquefichus massiliensis]
MKILFLTSYAVSHIIPIKSFILKLQSMGHDVVCLINSQNIDYCKENCINYIVYPNNYWKKKHREEAMRKDKKMITYAEEKDFIKFYDEFLSKDSIGIFNYYEDVSLKIEEFIDVFCPNVVFRDSTDIYWMKIKNKEKYESIKTVGYITNNLYSWDYLMNSWNYILPNFLGIVDYLLSVPKEYLINFKSHLEKIYQETASNLNEDYIRPFYQYDPLEKVNIIFSQKSLQPILNNRNNILICSPSKSDFIVEKNVSNTIKRFCKDKLIYIATGSFMSREINYYSDILKIINEKLPNYKIIISGGKATKQIKSIVNEMGINQKVLVKQRVPQLFVLKNSSIFITSGGMNSIKEAIFYKTPMIVFPISSEQRLNGMILEHLKIGITTYKFPSSMNFFENHILSILDINIDENFKQLSFDYDNVSEVVNNVFKKVYMDDNENTD